MTILGTDGRRYEVIRLLDAETRKPLAGDPLGLIAVANLERG